MKWITYTNVGIDRIGCAWLIKKHIDPEASFAFITYGERIQDEGVYFDIPGGTYSHHRGRCTFASLLKAFKISDPVLDHIALIIDGADCINTLLPEPESYGLEALCIGLRRLLDDDERALQQGAILFDALYAYLHGK